MPPTPAPTTRRTVLAGLGALGGVLGTGALAGCSVGGDGGSSPARPAAPTPDQVAATRALAAVREACDRVTATVSAHPGLGGELAPLLAVHRAHETTLADAVPPGAVPTGAAGATSPSSPSISASRSPTAVPSASSGGASTGPSGSASPSGPASSSSPTSSPSSSGPSVPRRPAAAVSDLVTREEQLHTVLDDLALSARSGDFARLLASMGAALGQQVRRLQQAGS